MIIGKYTMILCDIGNSTFHFLYREDEFKVSVDESLELEIFNNIDDEVYFISVNEKATTIFLTKFPNSINLKDKVKFDTKYASTLGIDRIVACKLFDDGIIVDFGSAITVDVMENKKHLGGFIMPGVDSLKMIYPQISQKLAFEFKTNIDFDKLPQNTDVAISFAIIKMVTASIEDIQKRYNHKLIITGETAKPFLPYLKNCEFNERLIFTSMKKIIEENV
jgi:type III pantothenate kinase